MQRTTLRSFALLTGLGLLPACPANVATTDTDAESSGTTSAETTDPQTDPTASSTPPTSTTQTTPPGETTEEPVTTTQETSSTDPGTTTDNQDTTAGDTEDTTTGPVDNLCSRLGGADAGIPELVTTFLGKVLTDDRINGYFLNADVDAGNLHACVVKQLGELAGCAGVTYDCQNMKDAHAGLGISQADFGDFVEDFVAAYDEHAATHPELTPEDETAIGDALGMMAGDIVEDPENNLTVYQRVGRKPNIKMMIGHPGEAGTFVDNVVNDITIASFFTNTNHDRFNTCLTRQVSSIDGPVKYGQEVTAPDGIDPGVSADDPCKDMKTAHEGLTDDMMEGITVEDFLALVMDLVTAMQTFMVSDADQTTILGVLGPMCDDIVAEPNTCPGNSKTELIEAVDLNLAIDNMAMNGAWDDKYNGMLDSMLCVDIAVADDGLNFVNDVRLKVGMDHSYVGDVTIKVVSPDAKVLTALGRPSNEPPLADNGVPCCGYPANLSAMFPFTLTDAATITGKDMGKGLTDLKVICKDENPKIDPCQFKPYKGGGPGTAFSDFKGKSAV
ncbi:MAG TPA: hypothetical protein VGB85_05165, partial [Nannocystis sp.]